MYTYSVKSRVNNEVVTAWQKFFVEHHLQDLINTECFTHYQFRRSEHEDPMSTYFIADYYFESMKDLERYESLFAKELKQDVRKRFAGKFHSERSIYRLLTPINH